MKIIFAGTPDFSIPTLNALLSSQHQVCAVYTQPDRPAGRGRKIQVSPIKQRALDAQIPIEQPVNFQLDETLHILANYQADLMVVVAYGIILPPTVLATPRLGCINIHASLLPRWRGAAPIQRAILSSDQETGVTLMQMDKGLDTGDMLLKATCNITSDDTSSSLHDKLSALGANTLLELLPLVEEQQLNPVSQAEIGVTYAHKLTKQEARINWNQPADLIQRAIQGYNPWPVAHTLLKGSALRIWQANVTTQAAQETPGTIKIIRNQLFVAGNDYYVEITELQAASKRRMTASEYLAAHAIDKLILGHDE